MRPTDGQRQPQPGDCQTQRLPIGQAFLPDHQAGRYGDEAGQAALKFGRSAQPITHDGESAHQNRRRNKQGPDERPIAGVEDQPNGHQRNETEQDRNGNRQPALAALVFTVQTAIRPGRFSGGIQPSNTLARRPAANKAHSPALSATPAPNVQSSGLRLHCSNICPCKIPSGTRPAPASISAAVAALP